MGTVGCKSVGMLAFIVFAIEERGVIPGSGRKRRACWFWDAQNLGKCSYQDVKSQRFICDYEIHR